jgi:hypothetical protein
MTQGRLLKNIGPTPQEEVTRHFTLEVVEESPAKS